jgi:predicted nucleic acid-binding protein
VSVLVDTCVWSELFRRDPSSSDVADRLQGLIQTKGVVLLGVVRQELLIGVPNEEQFERLRRALRAFDDLELSSADYETAAHFFNKCRAAGIQGSNTDFLICSVAFRISAEIFTLDAGFASYARVLPIRLFV